MKTRLHLLVLLSVLLLIGCNGATSQAPSLDSADKSERIRAAREAAARFGATQK